MKNMKPDIIDTHYHLDLLPKPEEIADEIITRATRVIAVTNAPSVFWFTKNLAQKSNVIYPSLGLHPELVKTHSQEISQFIDLLPTTRFVGEIGLDYSTKIENEMKSQRKIFQQILEYCATAGDKIINIHSRAAASDVISMIGSSFPSSIILHWFSGTIKQLNKAISNGYYFSVNTAMCSSSKGKEIIQAIPNDKILTESDGPFIQHQSNTVAPWDVDIVLEHLANIWDSTKKHASKRIMDNFVAILEN